MTDEDMPKGPARDTLDELHIQLAKSVKDLQAKISELGKRGEKLSAAYEQADEAGDLTARQQAQDELVKVNKAYVAMSEELKATIGDKADDDDGGPGTDAGGDDDGGGGED